MTCLGNGSGVDNCGPSYLHFNGAGDLIDLGSDASVDDLPNADFTFDCWAKIDSYGVGTTYLVSKLNAGAGWYIEISNANGITAFADYVGANALSRSSDLTADGLWHHIAVVFDTTTELFQIFIDGTEVSYTSQVSGTLGYNADGANTLYLGNDVGKVSAIDGQIGWARISNTKRWTTDFTAPTRCTLPTVDANTDVLVVYEGAGTTTYNLGSSTVPGTITGALWGCSCTIDNDPTCDNAIYVANKHNMANITDIYVYDASAGTFSANLQNMALPQILLPPVPAANDVVYFGCDTTIFNSGPFSNLVFEIGTAHNNVAFGINYGWEYWTGAAWSPLSIGSALQDNTNDDGAMLGTPFNTTGVRSVHWDVPTNWATTAVNGITGYWVRVIASGVGANPTPPIQVNRHVYSVTWPFVRVDESVLGGDLPVHLKVRLDNPSDGPSAPAVTPSNPVERVLLASRSASRGTAYTPIINLADEQNHADITIAVLNARAFVNDITFPTGRAVQDPGGGGVGVTVTIANPLANQYIGRFRVFLRGVAAAGFLSGFYSASLVLTAGEIFLWQSDTISNIDTLPTTPIGFVFDFGQINIPANYGSAADYENLQFQLTTLTVGIVANITLQDLILWPVDEWAGDFFSWQDASLGYHTIHDDAIGWDASNNKTELRADSIGNPKRNIQATVHQIDNDNLNAIYSAVANDSASLAIANDARLWVLTMQNYGGIGDNWCYKSTQVSRLQIYKMQRYLSMRGDR